MSGSAEWPRVKLGDVLRHVARPLTVDVDGIYREIGIRSHGKGLFHKAPVTGAALGDKRVFHVEPGDFVLNIVFAWEGAVGLVSEAERGMIASHRFPCFRAADGRVDLRFLERFFQTPAGLELLGRVSPGGAGRNRTLNRTSFMQQEIALPPLAAQQRIVGRIDVLVDEINRAMNLRSQTSELLIALAPAFVTRIVDRLSETTMLPIRNLGLGEDPIQIGPFGAQLHSSEFCETGVPVLNVGNVWPDGLRLTSLDHVTPEKAHALRRYAIRAGDLLFARSGATLGKVCIVPAGCDGWLMTGHLFRVRFDSTRVLNRFAFALIRYAAQIQELIFGQVRGATRPGYNTTLLGNVSLPVPSLPEQHRIVGEIDDLQTQIDELRTRQAQVRAELDALLPAILDRAFAGAL